MKEREIKISNISKSKNIIRMYGGAKIQDEFYFFFHFYNGGMLSELIKNK